MPSVDFSSLAEPRRQLPGLILHAKHSGVKRKKAQVEKTTAGMVIGAKYRERCNELTDAGREKLNKEFLKRYCADGARQPARRRRRQRRDGPGRGGRVRLGCLLHYLRSLHSVEEFSGKYLT